MKRITISLMLTCIAVISFATDFYVAESFDNTNNRFNTISAAIAAASDGDRIYVQDKPGAGYVEDLIIDKSISLINMNNNEKFTVTGNLTGDVYNRSLNINGLDLSGECDLRMKSINIFNSEFNQNCDIKGNVSTRIYGSVFRDTTYIRGNMAYQNGTLNYLTRTNTSIIDYIGSTSFKSCSISYADSVNIQSSVFKNTTYCWDNKITTIEGSYFEVEDRLLGFRSDEIINSRALIRNNTFNGTPLNNISYQELSECIAFIDFDNAYALIQNNVFQQHEQFGAVCYKLDSENLHIQMNYNIISNKVLAKTYTNQTYIDFEISGANTNITDANFTIDTNTFNCTGDNVNAGDPDPLMSDLDLTRNDAGCHGGPNSISNYFPQDDNGARVYKIEMPRRFFTRSNVNIKAYGVDK